MNFNENVFIHHVYFWLNNPASVIERNQLLKGLKKYCLALSSTVFRLVYLPLQVGKLKKL